MRGTQCGKSQGKAVSIQSMALFQAVEIWTGLLNRFLSTTYAATAIATTAATVAAPTCHPLKDVSLKGMYWAWKKQCGSRRQTAVPNLFLLKYKWRSEVKDMHKVSQLVTCTPEQMLSVIQHTSTSALAWPMECEENLTVQESQGHGRDGCLALFWALPKYMFIYETNRTC